ncbi:activin A receptor type 2 punt isoform X3 [Rhipicephalus microplus]|uniref:activin A receptor type 2 punt isoform X3 n=1 Tax=Rhipicephalus microplus TaxID=6941 RepID=UPI003F6BC7A0
MWLKRVKMERRGGRVPCEAPGINHRWTVCLLVMSCLAIAVAVSPDRPPPSLMRCEYYNETLCQGSPGADGQPLPGCNGSEECRPGENEKGNLCYVLWQNNSGVLSVKLKGCWVGNNHDCSQSQHCAVTRREPSVQLLFCCCVGDLCNANLQPSAVITSGTPLTTRHSPPVQLAPHGGYRTETVVAYILVPLFTVVAVVVLALYLHQKRKQRQGHFAEVPTADPTPLPSPALAPKAIQLVEVKAQGRFGAVWKARWGLQFVAVKIFPPQDKTSWMVEKDIFKMPQMKHENLLAFLGSTKHGDLNHTEYWLVTEYHERGSLSDHLKAHLVSWGEVLKISEGIALGLSHMHGERPANKLEGYKPPLAHRDFKSKNVLLKADMTACIADFGLALAFPCGVSPRQAHGQVGTRRYMAPEVLEGAISFNQDQFLRIDMYACGLVLWELISRCSAQDGPVEEYMLPFEEEVGQHPSLEDMQEAVAHKKMRPRIRDHWRKHPGLAVIIDTIEECWDHDAEARLSANCVEERISSLYKTVPPTPTDVLSLLPSGDQKGMDDFYVPVVNIKSALETAVLLPPKESSI